MDVNAITAVMGSLKTAAEVAKTLFDIKSTAEVQRKVIDIQSALLAAQNSALSATTSQFELQERVRELEAQLKAANDWGAQKTRYALVSPWRGAAQAYALKEEHAGGEAPHLLCANCFHGSKRVVLNPARRDGWMVVTCPECKASLDTGFKGIGAPVYAERYAQAAQQTAG